MNNFEVLDLYLEYDEQYLFIEAKPVKETSEKIHPLEESVEDLKKLDEGICEEDQYSVWEWRQQLEGL